MKTQGNLNVLKGLRVFHQRAVVHDDAGIINGAVLFAVWGGLFSPAEVAAAVNLAQSYLTPSPCRTHPTKVMETDHGDGRATEADQSQCGGLE
jgi:hypothetical protein